MSPPGRPRRGLTTIELMVTLAIAALLTALAAPSLYRMIQRKRVVGAAEELRSELRQAQRLAMSNMRAGSGVAVQIGRGSNASCFTVYLQINAAVGQDCSCLRSPVCTGPVATEIKTVRFPTGTGVALTPSVGSTAVSSGAVLFHRPSGQLDSRWVAYATDLTVQVGSGAGGVMRLRLDPSGRGSLCSVGGDHSGYEACS